MEKTINKKKTEMAVAKELSEMITKRNDEIGLTYTARYILDHLPPIIAALEALRELENKRDLEKNPLIVKE